MVITTSNNLIRNLYNQTNYELLNHNSINYGALTGNYALQAHVNATNRPTIDVKTGLGETTNILPLQSGSLARIEAIKTPVSVYNDVDFTLIHIPTTTRYIYMWKLTSEEPHGPLYHLVLDVIEDYVLVTLDMGQPVITINHYHSLYPRTGRHYFVGDQFTLDTLLLSYRNFPLRTIEWSYVGGLYTFSARSYSVPAGYFISLPGCVIYEFGFIRTIPTYGQLVLPPNHENLCFLTSEYLSHIPNSNFPDPVLSDWAGCTPMSFGPVYGVPYYGDVNQEYGVPGFMSGFPVNYS